MFKVDLHTHTLMSGHAYCTITEMAQAAKQKGMQAIAITDHGPIAPGSAHIWYFDNLYRCPDKLCGVNIIRGCEVNIIDKKGTLDLPKKLLEKLDLIIISLHEFIFAANKSVAENTKIIINALKNNRVHIIAHPYRPEFKTDIAELFMATMKRGALLEINMDTIKRNLHDPEFIKSIKLLVNLAVKYQYKVAINSDAHMSSELGDDSILKKLPFKIPRSIRINTYQEYQKFFNKKAVR